MRAPHLRPSNHASASRWHRLSWSGVNSANTFGGADSTCDSTQRTPRVRTSRRSTLGSQHDDDDDENGRSNDYHHCYHADNGCTPHTPGS
jgi:hypothetical protein